MTEARKPGRPLSKVSSNRVARIEALEIGGSTTISNAGQNDIRSLRVVLKRRGIHVSAITVPKGIKLTRVEAPSEV